MAEAEAAAAPSGPAAEKRKHDAAGEPSCEPAAQRPKLAGAAAPAADEARLRLHAARPKFEYHTERYYTNLPLAAQEGGGAQYLALHLNDLVVVGVAPEHPAVQEPITHVNFNVGKKGEDRLAALKPRGKKKAGGQYLKRDSKIAVLTGASGAQYKVVAGVDCTLVELNEALISTPDLVRQSPTDQGWVGVAIPAHKALAELKQRAAAEGLEKKSAFQSLGD
eukprot:TRINITY_DN4254_c0_g1_i1.p1 TRINITY_DN4254_c0_g1~~TRINITY_DN4254_c0_g1_i1.p1  ORF type:complete len:237 (+),score=122.94 TRINITY_DN4254_c0_g1_i1:48-713(+)